MNTFKWWLHLIPFMMLYSCSEQDPSVDCNNSTLSLSLQSKTDAVCGQENGSIEVVASGGEGNYQYSLDGLLFQSAAVFEDLSPGMKTLYVKDELGCQKEIQVEIEELAAITVSVESTESGCEASAGSITITASSVNGSLTYSLDGVNFQASAEFNNLSANNYTVTVLDGAGCKSTQLINVSSGVSLESMVMPILDTKCATTNACHNNPAGDLPDFKLKEDIISHAAAIEFNIDNDIMPPDGETDLTAAEKETIYCWIADGAPDN